MVGDPQQLPATILSALAKEVAMERSLFERLQKQGCPVKMLSVQYRMHPAIRQVRCCARGCVWVFLGGLESLTAKHCVAAP